jgi:hypothetical protein
MKALMYMRELAIKSALLVWSEALIVAAGVAGYMTIAHFGHSPYRFVAVFLLGILLSNILAKTAIVFIEASRV